MSKKEKPPAFLFYPKDFLSSGNVKLMDLAVRGAYITLLSYAWLDDGLPIETAKLAKLCDVDALAFKPIWEAICKHFYLDHSGPQPVLRNERQERERKKRKKFCKDQQTRAKNRWNKDLEMVPTVYPKGTEETPSGNALHLQYPFAFAFPKDSRNPCGESFFKTHPGIIFNIFGIQKPAYIFQHPDAKQYTRILFELTQFEEGDIVREMEMVKFRDQEKTGLAPAYFMKSVWGRLTETRNEVLKAPVVNNRISELVDQVLSGGAHAMHSRES